MDEAGEPYRGYHDMGGEPAGAVARVEHDHAFWEKRVDAILVLLGSPERQVLRVDELRRGIESLGPEAYEQLSYYERWINAIKLILVEKGVLTEQEIDQRIAALKAQAERPA